MRKTPYERAKEIVDRFDDYLPELMDLISQQITEALAERPVEVERLERTIEWLTRHCPKTCPMVYTRKGSNKITEELCDLQERLKKKTAEMYEFEIKISELSELIREYDEGKLTVREFSYGVKSFVAQHYFQKNREQ